MARLVSIIIPAYNEEKNIPVLYEAIKKIIDDLEQYEWEIIFVNDGSQDQTLEKIEALVQSDPRARVIDFSRNFGKEAATSAGLHASKGDAMIMIDADLQHPVELIPEFLKKWEEGIEVVVGVRGKNKGEGITKKMGSYLFYKIINQMSETRIISGSTDFRLLDRVVVNEFNRLTEKNRMTRALIDWMGFRREYIYFQANERKNGRAAYSFTKLVRLAFNSMVSLSLFPLRLAGYLGIFITIFSGILGLFMFIDRVFFDKFGFSGSEILAALILFLVGIILICLGLTALYIANIHVEVNNRPMYIIRKDKS